MNFKNSNSKNYIKTQLMQNKLKIRPTSTPNFDI